jgi:hypothetical protein
MMAALAEYPQFNCLLPRSRRQAFANATGLGL